jgi:hypothetical protein
MASLRLDPARHPIPDDRVAGLFGDAIRASRRRSDVSAPMKLMFIAWFGAMALAPRRLASRLAVLFLFPERRALLNHVLKRFSKEPR